METPYLISPRSPVVLPAFGKTAYILLGNLAEHTFAQGITTAAIHMLVILEMGHHPCAERATFPEMGLMLKFHRQPAHTL